MTDPARPSPPHAPARPSLERAVVTVVVLALLGERFLATRDGVGVALGLVAFLSAAHAARLAAPAARLAVVTAGALAATVSFAVAPAQWPLSALAVAAGALTRAPRGRELLIAALPVMLPGALLALAAGSGVEGAPGAVLGAVRGALPAFPALLFHGAAVVAGVVLVAGDSAPPGAPPVLLASRPAPGGHPSPRLATVVALGAAATGLAQLALRARELGADARVAADTQQWSEPPLLMNVLKRELGLPLFGPLEEVGSFTYTPVPELLQAALLRPFGAALDVVAHRGLSALWQGLTALLVGAAVARSRPPGARLLPALAAAAVALGLMLASPTSWFLHPDHLLHVVVALGLVVALAPAPDRPAARALLLLGPAAATAVKLTGAGVGLGLGLWALWRRDRRTLAWLAGAAPLVLLVPGLLELGFPGFRRWGLELMSTHPVRWGRLAELWLTPHGRVMASSVALLLVCPRSARRSLLGPALFGAGVAAMTVLAYLKVGGRENNLVAGALVFGVVGVLAWTELLRAPARLACAALLTLGAVVPLPIADRAAERERLRADHRAVVAFLRAEAAAGAATLVHSGTVALVESGLAAGPPREARDGTIPVAPIGGDGLHPAVELYLASHPAFELHLERLARARWGSVVTPGMALTAGGLPGRSLGAALTAALAGRYCVVYPLRPDGTAVGLDHGRGTLILRRRDRGCAPLVPLPAVPR